MSFLRAIELDPSHTGSMNNLSTHESFSGRNDESLYWARRAFALSAKRGNDFYHVSVPLSVLDRGDMREWLLEAEHRAPPHPRVQFMLGILDALEGRAAEARQRLDAAHTTWPRNEEVMMARADAAFISGAADAPGLLEALMHTPEAMFAVPATVRLRVASYARQHDPARAADLLAEAERTATQRIDDGDASAQPSLELASVAMMREQAAEAVGWLERAYEAGFREPLLLERHPLLAPLAADPRFTTLLDRRRADTAAQLARARERGLLDLTALLPADR